MRVHIDEREKQTVPESPAEFRTSLPAGGQLVVALPDSLDPLPVVQGFAGALPDGEACAILSDLGEAASPAEARKRIAAAAKADVVVDCTSGLAPWADKPDAVAELIQHGIRQGRKASARVVWVVARRYLTAAHWDALRAEADLFVHFASIGPWVYCQVLHARGDVAPEMYLPRTVKFSSRSFRIGRPLFPIQPREELTDAGFEVFRQTFQGAGEGLVAFDPQGGFREANRRALELLGRTAETLASATFASLVAESSRPAALRLLALARRKQRASEEIEILREAGKASRVRVTLTAPLAHHAIAVLGDVGPGRARAAAGALTTADLAEAFRTSPLPQAVVAGRTVVEGNAAFRELFASLLAAHPEPTLQQVLGKAAAVLPRDLAKAAEAGVEQRFNALRVELPDGARIMDLLATRAPLRGRRGVLLTLYDVTERAERAAHQEEATARLRALVDTDAASAIVVREGIVVWANRGFASLLGATSPEDLAGKEVAPLLAPRDRKSAPGRLSAVEAEEGAVTVFEYTALPAGGKPLRMEATVQRIEYEGAPAGFSVHRALTGKLKSSDELRARIDDLTRLDRIRAATAGRLDPTPFLHAALEATIKQVGLDGGASYLAPHGRVLTMIASSGMPEDSITPLRELSLEEGFAAYVAKTMEPLHLLIAEYPPFLPYRSLFETLGFGTLFVLPLVDEGNLAGMLLLASVKPIDPTDLPMEFLTALTAQLGAGLSTALRFAGLEATLSLHQSVAEGITPVTYQVGQGGAVEYIAPHIEQWLGYPAGEFRRNPDLWRQAVHPDDRSIYSSRLAGSGGGSASGTVTYQMLPKGKAAYLRIQDSFVYHRGEDGALRSITGVLTDVTNRKDEADAAAGRTLESFIDNMADALIVTDLQGRIAEVNREFTRLTGYARHEVLGAMLPYPWLHEEEMGNVVAWISALREKQNLRDFDMTWVRKDGHRVAISLNTTMLTNEAGEPRAMLNIARNISERKALSNALSRQVARTTALYQLGEGLTASLDTESVLGRVAMETLQTIPYDRLVYATAEEGEPLQPVYAASATSGQPVRGVLADSDVSLTGLLAKDLPLRSGIRRVDRPVLAATVRGKTRTHGVLILASEEHRDYSDDDLRLLESIATLAGIALDRAILYEDTLRQSAEIQARNRELDDFTYVVSHDLKEPLITIEGYSTIVARDYAARLDDEGVESLQSIVHASQRMKRLIDDLLTLSRVGRDSQSPEDVATATVVQGVMHDLEFTLKERNARVEVEGTLPVVQYLPTQLGLVFRNLIANGVKFNTSTEPIVRVGVREVEGAYEFSVADNGIGIPQEYFDRIFVIFQRLHTAEQYPGTGAGLTIVKKIVERHHGRIWVESMAGTGTTFFFTVPR